MDLSAFYAVDGPPGLPADAPAQPGTAKKAGKRKITDARRERNRKAQTRYRWKCKEEIQDLEQRVQQARAAVDAALPRRRDAQARYEATSVRLNKATSEYIELVQQRGGAAAVAAAAQDGAACAAGPAGPPREARAARALRAADRRAQMRSYTAALDGVFSPEAAAVDPGRVRYVPCGSERPLDAYPHAAALSLGECTRHMHGAAAGSGGASELALADAVDAYKAAEAAAAGVPPGDTCWFVRCCYRVDGATAAPCVAGGAVGVTGAAPCITYSSVFASEECRLAYFVFFLAMSLELALLTTEEDSARADVADSVATDLKSQAQIALDAGPAKRSRGGPANARTSPRSTASTATLADPLLHPTASNLSHVTRSTSGVSGSTGTASGAAPARVSCDLADNPIVAVDDAIGFDIRCGVGGTCCAVTATRRIFARIMADALRHMRRDDVDTVCRQFLSFLHGVLGVGGPAPPPHSADGGPGGPGMGPLGLDLDSLVERIMPPSAEADMHVAVVIQTTVDTVVGALRDAPFPLDPEMGPPGGAHNCKARLEHVASRVTEITSTWGFSWLCLLADAKRLSRALAVKAAGKHQEFAELVDVMYVRVYKAIGLSDHQRRFLADFWSTWLRRREALDDDLAAALSRAAALPGPSAVSTDLLRVLDAAIAHPPREVTVPLCAPCEEDAGSGFPPHAVPRQLLGMSARSTRAAEEAALALVEVHHRDARQMEDFMSGFVLPAWFMTSAQRSRLNCAHVRHACVPMEMLVVCRMAAAELRRGGNGPPGRRAAGATRR